MFEATVRDDALRLRRPGTRWLSTGWAGGLRDADAAYNLSVPEGFDRTDLDAYVAERRERAGFDDPGPALLTGVAMRHARGARHGSVEAVATAGISNPAALPMVDPEPSDSSRPPGDSESPDAARDPGRSGDATDEWRPGTVNVVVGTTRALDDAGLATLLSVAVEAKTAALTAETGFPGTTTDAVVAGCDPSGEAAAFAGSGTPVGAAARACVRDAVRASLESRYASAALPESVAAAEYGVETDFAAETFDPDFRP